MKRITTTRIALVLAALLPIATFAPIGRAQQARKSRGDTGVITLGVVRLLRVTVSGRDGKEAFRVRFAWMKYMPAGCTSDGVCRHTIQSQGVTTPVNVSGNEAAS